MQEILGKRYKNMKFRAYKMAFCKEIPSTVLTNEDSVRLVIKMTPFGMQWEIRGSMQDTLLASSIMGYTLDLTIE